MQQRKALKMQPRCAQQLDYAVPHLLEIYRKSLSWGHLAIRNKMLVPNGVHYRGVPLYTLLVSSHDSTFLPIHTHHPFPPIFLQYMVQVLHAGDNMEFFIEGSRSRSGKPGMPKAGLLSVLVDSVKEGTWPLIVCNSLLGFTRMTQRLLCFTVFLAPILMICSTGTCGMFSHVSATWIIPSDVPNCSFIAHSSVCIPEFQKIQSCF